MHKTETCKTQDVMSSDECVYNILCFMLTYIKDDDIIISVGNRLP